MMTPLYKNFLTISYSYMGEVDGHILEFPLGFR